MLVYIVSEKLRMHVALWLIYLYLQLVYLFLQKFQMLVSLKQINTLPLVCQLIPMEKIRMHVALIAKTKLSHGLNLSLAGKLPALLKRHEYYMNLRVPCTCRASKLSRSCTFELYCTECPVHQMTLCFQNPAPLEALCDRVKPCEVARITSASYTGVNFTNDAITIGTSSCALSG